MPDFGADPILTICLADGSVAEIIVDAANRRISGCSEWQNYEITVNGPDSYRLFVDDAEPLPRTGANNVWLWSAGFFAGEVLLEVVDSRESVRLEYRLDVSPAPHKLEKSEFTSMLDELFAFDAGLLFGLEAAQNSIGADGGFGDPHLGFARLKLFGPSFVAALANLQRKPQMRLRYERERRQLHQVRRMDAATIQAAVHDPTAARILRYRTHATDCVPLPTFNVPSVEHTVDNPANRTILALAHALLRRLRHVRGEFERILVAPRSRWVDYDEFKSRLPRRLQFLSALETSMQRMVKSYPFVDVSRPEVSAAGLNTVAAHPTYARAYRTGWHAIRPGISGNRGEEMLWTSPTWQVYERWAFLQIVKVLRKLLGDAPDQVTHPSAREDCIWFSCASGGMIVNAYLQPRFPAHDQVEWHDFRSISGERFPDIVVSVEHGDERRFVVFDAKYRVSRSGVLEGMESAHIYRDSLRWKGLTPDVALLLVPVGGGAPWLEEAVFQGQHRVGVVSLSASRGSARLEHLLSSYLLPAQ